MASRRMAHRRVDRRAGLAVVFSLCLGALACASGVGTAKESESGSHIFVARKIVTMDPARPTASAVAVREGRIAAVGRRGQFDQDRQTVTDRI